MPTPDENTYPNLPPRWGCVTVECQRCGGRCKFVSYAVPRLYPIATIPGLGLRLTWAFTEPTDIDHWWLTTWARSHLGPFKPVAQHFHD